MDELFHYYPDFLDEKEEAFLFDYLECTNDFKSNPRYNDGFSRMQKWFQKDGKYFCPKWKERYDHWHSFAMEKPIEETMDKVQKFIELNTPNLQTIPTINSCLVNKYTNGNNFIAPHRDSEISFGRNPTIVIVSIGQPRFIHFESIDKKEENFSLLLKSKSLFIMTGTSQSKFLHSIKKEDCSNVRYSLTFREYIL